VSCTCQLNFDGIMWTGKKLNTLLKPVLVPLCPPQIPHVLAKD
jgi:hypothetical protein